VTYPATTNSNQKLNLCWLLDSSIRILVQRIANIAQTRYHADRSDNLLGVDSSVIEAIIVAWKQLISHLKHVIKGYTKPLTSGLVIGVLSDATRSRCPRQKPLSAWELCQQPRL
jgi:hypothetical protein